MKHSLVTPSLAALGLVFCLSAAAHGPQGHGAAGQARAAVVKEQKPWGIAGDPAKARRVIEIRMGDDMRFTPSFIDVREGETVRLVVRNTGRVMHELVLGTREELQAHAEMMKKHPNMEHDEPYMAHVEPGKTGEVFWTFNRSGRFEFGCLIPGHFDAGMKGGVAVAARPKADATGVVGSLSFVSSTAATAPDGELADGEVRRITADTGRISLKHGEIKHLEMPPMTMVFQVSDKALLEGLKVGDRVRFRVMKDGSRYVITAIERQP
jgi:uncharacterized cupredoxin-like copper-binding protein/Cu/Ag efflux protein CusF